MTFRKESNAPSVIMILDKLPPLAIGGAETQALRLAKRLVQMGVNMIFLTPGRDKIKGYGEIEGMPVYRLHSFFNYAWDFLSALKKKTVAEPVVQIDYDDATQRTNEVTTPIVIGVKLRYLIFYFNCFLFLLRRRNQFDIIHVHSMEWPSFVGAWLARFFDKRLILKDATMNGINGLARYPAGKEKLKVVIDEGHFVAMTKAIHNNYISFGVPNNKIVDIPNGIEITEQHKKIYAEKNRKVIFVGNLSQQPAKGIDILLKAWKKVAQNYPDAKLLVVGDGPLAVYNDYLVKNNIHTSVTLLGKRADVKNLLMESDIFVLPSRREGMPNALMEAMLLGLPCIGTDISGCQDLIADGTNGILVPPANIEKLSEALAYLMENAEAGKRMGTLARETICTFNSMEVVSKQYLSLYIDLVKRQTT